MGIFALPGGITAKKDNPDRQVWNIMGDGAFNSATQTLSQTFNTTFQLSTLSSNGKYAFIKDNTEEQINTCLVVTS